MLFKANWKYPCDGLELIYLQIAESLVWSSEFSCLPQAGSLEFLLIFSELRTNYSELLSFAKVMEHYPFYYIPLTFILSPVVGGEGRVKGAKYVTQCSITFAKLINV